MADETKITPEIVKQRAALAGISLDEDRLEDIATTMEAARPAAQPRPARHPPGRARRHLRGRLAGVASAGKKGKRQWFKQSTRAICPSRSWQRCTASGKCRQWR